MDRFSVRVDNRWKIVFGVDRRHKITGLQTKGPALFDLRTDPGELSNLIHDPVAKKRYTRIHNRYRDWKRANAANDQRYGGRKGSPSDEDRKMLEALGYVSD